MFTFERYSPAFTDAAGREAFFRNAQHGVAFGTAMTHVLGSNTGIWGDERALAHDAARILMHELDAYADKHGEDRLGLPPEVVARTQPFNQAFSACRRFNVEEIDSVVTRLRSASDPTVKVEDREKMAAEEDPAVERFTSEQFVGDLYRTLCSVADRYHNEKERHRHAMGRIGPG